MSDLPQPDSESHEERRTRLEQRYIELLEKRVARLEQLVDESSAGGPSSVSKIEEKVKPRDQSEEHGKKPRIRRVMAKSDRETGIRSDIPDEEDLKKSKEEYVTFRRVLPSQLGGKDGFCEVDIVEGPLRSLLARLIDEYPGQSWGGEIVNIETPFMPLVHNWGKLNREAALESSGDAELDEARQALQEILDLIKSSPELSPFFKTRQSHMDAKVTSYETMWSLFKPGSLVYARAFLQVPQLLMVEVPPYNWSRDEFGLLPSKMEVSCWCYEWNGKEVVKCYYKIPVDQFRGTKPIKDLAIYPVEYFEGDEDNSTESDLRQNLVQRGSRYNQHVRERKGASQMFQYNGEAVTITLNSLQSNIDSELSIGSLDDPRDRISVRRRKREPPGRRTTDIKGNILIDTEAFMTYGGGSLVLGNYAPYRVEAGGLAEVTDIANNARKRIVQGPSGYTTDEQNFLELLPPRFLGYSTKDKMWGQFAVDQTKPAPKPNPDLFNSKLQLEQKYKGMIKALVENHAGKNTLSEDRNFAVKDIASQTTTSGKGRGLVLLFHGPPGVGKTLTAETIAEATGKPLLVVSVAEIGLDASKAERNLEQMFSLASNWEAILLVDEADVFLESRTSLSDAARNALVSVLLRVLEYYEGIMILTTNRITSLDVAVQSRIHLAVRYDDLQKNQKKEIFEQYLDQLEPDSISSRSAIDDWIDESAVEYEFNGRQIRNLVQASLAVARSDKTDSRVTKEHLKRVLQVYNDFSKDLETTTREARQFNEAARFRR